MKKIGVFLVALMVSVFMVNSLFAAKFLVVRDFGDNPPPYEISLWGTAGILVGNFTNQGDIYRPDSPEDVDLVRGAFGVDFMFRFWYLGLGIEYSRHTLERLTLNTNDFTAPVGWTLSNIQIRNEAEAWMLKAKIEAASLIFEAGVGYYMPQVGLYETYNYTVGGTNYTDEWVKRSVAEIEPKVIVSFAMGYPIALSDYMDFIAYGRVNIFSTEESISKKTLNNIANTNNTTTIDLGFKLRVAFY